MALFENTRNDAKVIRENMQFLRRNTLNNYSKRRKSNDEIKESLNFSGNEYTKFIKMIGSSSNYYQERSVLVNSFFQESHAFYNQNMKTSLFKTFVNKVASRVVDTVKITNENGEVIEEVNFNQGVDYLINQEEFKKISENLILYDNTFIKIDVFDGVFSLSVLEPFKIVTFENGYGYLFKKDGSILMEKRFKDQSGKFLIQLLEWDEKEKELTVVEEIENVFNNNLIFELKTDLEIVKDGLLEMLMMYSQLFSTVQKEIVMSSTKVFADKGYLNSEGYDYLREAYVPVSTPDLTGELTDTNKPLWQTYQSEIRATELNLLRDFIKDEISIIMQMDRSSLGLDSSLETATATIVKQSQTADTINILKKIINDQLNKFIRQFTGMNYNVLIPNYQVKDDEYITNNLKNSTQFMTVKTAVKILHEEWTTEQQEMEYLTIMYQKGIPFTVTEEKRAEELGIIVKEEFEGIDNVTIL